MISNDPALADASAKIASDVQAFLASGGRIERLPTNGNPVSDVSHFNGRLINDPKTESSIRYTFDRDKYVTVTDIGSEEFRKGILPIGRATFLRRVKAGKYPSHAHAIGTTRLWLRSDIEAIARGES